MCVCQIVCNLHKPLSYYAACARELVRVCACVRVRERDLWFGEAKLHACLQSVCLLADRSILNHVSVNILQKHWQQ